MAAGLSIRADRLEEFRERFCAYVSANATEEILQPRLDIDLEARFADLDLELLDHYELVHPMGMGNPAPLMMSRNVRPTGEPRILKEKHLKFNLEQDGAPLDVLYFNAAGLDLPSPPWDIAYRISRNVYRGRSSLSVILEGLRSAS